MKTLYIFTIVVFSNCINAQFEDDQNYWGNRERKMSGFESKDEAPKQHNLFSSHYDNLHNTGDAENSLRLYERRFNDGFEKANNIGINTEADIESAFARRLQSESKLIGLNGDNMKSDGSIVSGVQSNSNQTQNKSSATNYNIFDAKSAVKHQTTVATIPTTLKPVPDKIIKYNNITILILDENNKIHNQLSVPILNTSHIIIKAFSNNIITDLQPESIASNKKYLQRETTKLVTTNTPVSGKLTYTSINSQGLDHSMLTSTSTQFPSSSINTAERNSIDSKIKNSEHLIPVNTHHNEVLNGKCKVGEFHEHPSLRTAVLKATENHTVSNTTDNSVREVTNGLRSFSEQQTSINSIYLNQNQINGTVINNTATEELESQSNIEPTILKMSKSNTEQSTTAIAYTLKRYTANSTSTTKHNYFDSMTGILTNFFSPTLTPKTILKNSSFSGGQDLHLSLKPAVLEIIEESSDRNKNMSSKNRFVNVYVPTFEFTQSKNISNEQYKALNEGKIINSGKLQLLRIDPNTQNETFTSRPVKNAVHEIESSTPIGKSWTTTNEGLGHSKANDIFSQLLSVGSKITTPAILSVTLEPLSRQIIDNTSSLPRSLVEETNSLINILMGQQNISTIAPYHEFSSTTTT